MIDDSHDDSDAAQPAGFFHNTAKKTANTIF